MKGECIDKSITLTAFKNQNVRSSILVHTKHKLLYGTSMWNWPNLTREFMLTIRRCQKASVQN